MLSLMINEDYVGSECCRKKCCFFCKVATSTFRMNHQRDFYVCNSGLYPFLKIIFFNEVSTDFRSISRVYFVNHFEFT